MTQQLVSEFNCHPVFLGTELKNNYYKSERSWGSSGEGWRGNEARTPQRQWQPVCGVSSGSRSVSGSSRTFF